jgi:uncharacterized membrane protein
MKSQWLFFLAAILVFVGIIFLAISWHGTFGVTGAFPTSSSSVQLSGAASGGSAVLGLFALIIGLILLVVSMLRAVMEPFRRKPSKVSSSTPTTTIPKPPSSDPYTRS